MTTSDMNFAPKGLYIGGRWVPGVNGQTFASINPSNSETLGEVPYAGEEDVDQAVKAAQDTPHGRAVYPGRPGHSGRQCDH